MKYSILKPKLHQFPCLCGNVSQLALSNIHLPRLITSRNPWPKVGNCPSLCWSTSSYVLIIGRDKYIQIHTNTAYKIWKEWHMLRGSEYWQIQCKTYIAFRWWLWFEQPAGMAGSKRPAPLKEPRSPESKGVRGTSGDRVDSQLFGISGLIIGLSAYWVKVKIWTR